jgi:large subunit ribosomal protein L15
MNINEVNRGIQKHKARKRLGRGIGSGQGKTAGRGHKGAGSRAGNAASTVFEGGQMPLVRRIPKRGFTNQWAESVAVINVGDLQELFEAGDEVSPASLRTRRILRGQYDLLKVLGHGELSKSLKISAHRVSKQALEKIQKAGGEVSLLPGKKPVVKNKQRSARKPG